jgi:hypothetical protein
MTNNRRSPACSNLPGTCLQEAAAAGFGQVARLDGLLKAGRIGLEAAARILEHLGIHPWSLLGGYGPWDERQREWGARLGMPPAWVEALGPRVPDRPGVRAGSGGTALRIPVDLALERLPDGLKVRNLEIRHCPRLGELGSGLAVQERLSLHSCGCLQALPGDLRVGRSLVIGSCPGLGEIRLWAPLRELFASRNCNLGEVHLPLGFTGNLGLEQCCRLDTLGLPGGMLENLFIKDCPSLGVLPVAEVRRGLRLESSREGEAGLLPGVQVGGSAWLGFCQEGAVRIPAGLRVGLDLVLDPLWGVDELEIPADVQVGGHVHLSQEFLAATATFSLPGHLRQASSGESAGLQPFDYWGTE